jgi:hypothetical protein
MKMAIPGVVTRVNMLKVLSWYTTKAACKKINLNAKDCRVKSPYLHQCAKQSVNLRNEQEVQQPIGRCVKQHQEDRIRLFVIPQLA